MQNTLPNSAKSKDEDGIFGRKRIRIPIKMQSHPSKRTPTRARKKPHDPRLPDPTGETPPSPVAFCDGVRSREPQRHYERDICTKQIGNIYKSATDIRNAVFSPLYNGNYCVHRHVAVTRKRTLRRVSCTGGR